MSRPEPAGPVAVAILTVVCILASSCNPGGGRGVAGPVDVDTSSPGDRISLAAYLPGEVRAHPGETVTFRGHFSGEPHTVSLGRLVDRAASANAEKILSGVADEAPELKEIPALAPADLAGGQNRLLRPCYLRSGEATEIRSCSSKSEAKFDGRHSLFSSGILSPSERFSVELSESITPGAYAFMCLVHRSKMMGQITVVDPAVALPSSEQVRSRADIQRLSATNALRAAVEQAGQPSPDAALAGVSLPQLASSVSNVFLPESASIPTGGSVTWNVFGSHVIAFNPPQDALPFVAHPRPLRFNRAAVAPAGGPAAPARPPVRFSAGSEQPLPTVVEGGSWDGKGFRSSGMLFSFAPALLAYKLTFTSPGTYPYQCLIRPAMRGSVVVGEA